MTALVDVRVAGAREVEAMLKGMADRASDASPALRDVADWLRGQMAEAFTAQGRNLPSPWRGLAESTRLAKAHRGFDPRVLVRRGDLMRSLTTQGDGHTEHVTPSELRFGTTSRVVPVLRHGGRDPVQAPRDMDPAARIIEQWIASGGHQ